MDKKKNYYGVLGVDFESSIRDIKKAYYKLSLKYHPDHNDSDDAKKSFENINTAYRVLTDSELREEYDCKSIFGKNYDVMSELLDVDFNFDFDNNKKIYETFKRNTINNIKIEVSEDFDGVIEYERYVRCKSCDGSGKDFSSKIEIRDVNGKVIKTFDSDDGCDFCEGSGLDYKGDACSFCNGQGKVGLNNCKSCNGEKRILGKQRLKGVSFNGLSHKIPAMGHYAFDGKTGFLLLVKPGYSEDI